MIFIDLKRRKMSVVRLILLIFLFFIQFTQIRAITFAWLSDTHIETGLQFKQDTDLRLSLSVDILENAVEYINDKDEVSFVIITGDLVNSAKSWNLDVTKFILSKLNKPYFVVIGNNDFSMPNDGVGTGKTCFHITFKENEPNFNGRIWFRKYKTLLLIGIDNINPIDSSMYFDDRLMSDIKKVIEEETHEKVLIFLHYPIIEYSDNIKSAIQPIAKNFLDFCTKYKIDYIFSGHYHYYENQNMGLTKLFIQASLDTYPHEFSLVEITENKIVIKHVSAENKFIIDESRQMLQNKLYRIYQTPKANFIKHIMQKTSGEKIISYER